MKKRILIVSCRLPVKIISQDEQIDYIKSAGGLATGLDSLETPYEKHWIGWPGENIDDEEKQKKITEDLNPSNIHPVFLTQEQFKAFYLGYSNSTLWPLFHYFYVYTHYESHYWEKYQEVNNIFFQKLKTIISKDDIVWVQDYQLMLLPGLIRDEFPDLTIGFFLHIPFPSYELFRILPERGELLKGLLGADLIGFHTFDYMRHFISSTYRILGLECNTNEISYKGRIIQIDTFPMGINFMKYHLASDLPEVQEFMNQYKMQFGGIKTILTVDRLDYSKGIPQRIKAFESFLQHYPEYHNKISLVMIVVPSRGEVEKYQNLKVKIDKMVGAINGKYSNLNWIPVNYLYRNHTFEQLSALYYLSDIALVTPLRDGMNLVAKEYVASKKNTSGVLILSEMAGAATELNKALVVNPNDISAIERAILNALKMSTKEQRIRLQAMQESLLKNDVGKWAGNFISELRSIKEKQKEIHSKQMNKASYHSILSAYAKIAKRLILLDYDGTLVGFSNNITSAKPDPELLQLIRSLTEDPSNDVFLLSGRDQKTLNRWFGKLNICIFAEHGAFFYDKKTWHSYITSRTGWKQEIWGIMNHVTEKTPFSFVEEKKTSLVWHFRQSDTWLAELREKQLMEQLVYPCSKLKLQIMKGNKILEVKVSDMNKGIATLRILKSKDYDFIMAIGDDQTDEDMFGVLPQGSYSIHVGGGPTQANYTLANYKHVRKLLHSLTLCEYGKPAPSYHF